MMTTLLKLGLAMATCIAIGMASADASAQTLPRRLPGLTKTLNPPWNPCSPQVSAGFETTCLGAVTSKLPNAEATRYATYRAGLLVRHLVMGRALSRVWLKEYRSSEDPDAELAHGRAVTFTKPGLASMTKIYIPWLDKSGLGSEASPDFVYGGDENPLLRGGLAMATFAMEYLATGNAESLQAALELLGYAERSEFITAAGERTGFFLRTRWKGDVDSNSGEAFFHASGDELTGLVLGLFWLNRALVDKAWTQKGDIARVKGMANRLGQQLQANQYFIVPPTGLYQARQLGWTAMFAFRWFAEEAFADITGNRYAAKFSQRAFERIKKLPYKGSGEKVDADMVGLIASVSDEYSAKQVAEALPVFIGVMLNHRGADLHFSCHVLTFQGGGMSIGLPYQYFNFSMFLHMANVVLQRNAEGKLNDIDNFKTQLRRLLRGVLYGKAATSFDLERFGLAYQTNLPAVVGETAELALLTLPGRVLTGGAVGGVLSAVLGPVGAIGAPLAAAFSGCNLDGGWQLGSDGYEDLNYWALAIAHAYDLMNGDSNLWFRNQLPVKIEQVRAQFGPDLPLSERKSENKQPLVYELAYDKVWGGLQYGAENAKLIADHNPQGFIGTSFAWEQGTLDGSQDRRRFDGGSDGDEGLDNDEIVCQYDKNLDVVREASGLDYLLPTALLAYRKGGAFLSELQGVGKRVHARLDARTSVPDEAVRDQARTSINRLASGSPPPRRVRPLAKSRVVPARSVKPAGAPIIRPSSRCRDVGARAAGPPR